MKREDLRDKFSQVVGISKAEDILADAEAALGMDPGEEYSEFEVRDLCEEIAATYDGYIGEIATEIRINAEAQQRFDTLLENVPDPAVVVTFVDAEPVVKTVNRAFESVFGYDRGTIRDRRLTDLLHTEGEISGMDVWAENDSGDDREVTCTVADGTQRTFLLRTAMETTIGGEIEGYAIYTDITDRIERERDLDLLKQVFSRVFRHNVRNELTVVDGRLGHIASNAEAAALEEDVRIARASTERLLSHAEKARDIERLVDATHERVDRSLREIAETAVERCAPLPDGVSLEVDVPDVDVRGVDGFEAAPENAVENAVGHNPTPLSVEVTADIEPTTASLTITDTGTGIAPSEADVLRSGEENPLAHGTGVGLWVMYWYVRKSGGELSVTRADSGTTVRMTLDRSVDLRGPPAGDGPSTDG